MEDVRLNRASSIVRQSHRHSDPCLAAPPLCGAPSRRARARGRFGIGLLAWLAVDEAGEEEMSYLLIFALVVLPMVYAARLLWTVLLAYFTIGSFVIDAPLF